MKYYRGTRKRKSSSKSKLSSPESQNTSNTVEESEVSRDGSTSNYESSLSKKKNAQGIKRPSPMPPLAGKQSTRQIKRAKSSNASPDEESNKNRKTRNTEKLPDSSDENEPKMSNSRKKRSESTIRKSSISSSRSDGSSRKRVKSSEAIQTSRSSAADQPRETQRNVVYETVRKNSKSRTAMRTNSKQAEPNSPESSETVESVFNDDEEEIGRGESESSFDISSLDVSSDGVISCSEFLQHQVRILKSEFEIEDCPELAAHLEGTKRQQKNHIPKEIVLKALQKLNFKVEDELLKSLNRQAQRKILQQVDEIRSRYCVNGKKRSNEKNTGQEPEGNAEELRETVEMSMAELDGLKRFTDMAAEIESMVEGFSTNPLVDEVKRTNKLIQKLNQKVHKQGFTSAHQETLTTKGPLSHQEIVDKLFL